VHTSQNARIHVQMHVHAGAAPAPWKT